MRTTFPADTVDNDAFPSPFAASLDDAEPRAAYTIAEVAALPTTRIAAMNRPELIEVIRSVRADHLRPGVRERLTLMDAETLRRLVYLTRRLCRNRQLVDGEDCPAATAANWAR